MANNAMIFLTGTNHPNRPVYDGTQSIHTFLKRYEHWCGQCQWVGTARTSNLTYCVDKRYQDQVRLLAIPADDRHPMGQHEESGYPGV